MKGGLSKHLVNTLIYVYAKVSYSIFWGKGFLAEDRVPKSSLSFS